MAITREGAALTAAHRMTQQQVTALTNKQVIRLWPLLNPTDQATWAGWLDVMSSTINAGGQLSARAARSYYMAFRVAEGASGRFTPTLPKPTPFEQISKSLTAVVGMSQQTESDNGLVYTLGSSQRMIANQGRDTLLSATQADPQAEGWARVASANACAFCAMLASRGAVYLGAHSANMGGVHDHCNCTVEPSFDQADYKMPPNSQTFRDEYEASQKDVGEYPSNTDRLNALRRYKAGSTNPTGVGRANPY